MKKHFIYIIIFLSLVSCDRRNELTQGSWIVTEGKFQGESIEFISTDVIQFTDANGVRIITLKFFDDGQITLPGINCSDIRALWKMENNTVIFTIDSLKYDFIYKKDEFTLQDSEISLVDSLLSNRDYIEKQKIKAIQEMNPLNTGEFDTAMEIYGAPFEVKINGDNLELMSKKTRIKAQKDRTIDKMFKGL